MAAADWIGGGLMTGGGDDRWRRMTGGGLMIGGGLRTGGGLAVAAAVVMAALALAQAVLALVWAQAAPALAPVSLSPLPPPPTTAAENQQHEKHDGVHERWLVSHDGFVQNWPAGI